MTAKQIRHARDLRTRPDNTAAAIASLPCVSHATTHKYILEVTTGRQAAVPASRPENASAEDSTPSNDESHRPD
jgi:hypothetical protein